MADEFLSAYAKAAAFNNDPRCVPVKLDGPIKIGSDFPELIYSETEHKTWQQLFERQQKSIIGRASEEFIKGVKLLNLPADQIPSIHRLDRKLEELSGWRIGYSPGLLDGPEFLTELSRRIMPCTNYIRTPEEIDYTPAPDLFHEVFGHMPLITNPDYAAFFQEFGQAALRADAEMALLLERFYWFTVEFGLIRQNNGLRIYGAGIISSYEETLHCLSDTVEKRPLQPQQMAEQEYDVWHLQPILFVIESFEQLRREFHHWVRKDLKLL